MTNAPSLQNYHRNYIREIGAHTYWFTDIATKEINNLNIPQTNKPFTPQWEYIRLPDWAADLEVEEKGLLIDISSSLNNDYNDWKNVDWWAAAFHHLNGTYERQIENDKGPLHSYSYRLQNAHPDMFDYAWVNRIFLFLRRWTAHELQKNESDIFPDLNQERILLTHDVDYIHKTLPLIIKKSVFDVIKIVKLCLRLRFIAAGKTIIKSLCFALTPRRYDLFDDIIKAEKSSGYTSVFHFYAGKKCPKQSWLLDPSYSLNKISNAVERIQESGGKIGLHPSYHYWNDPKLISLQKSALEEVINIPINYVRQHWLRFSWKETWQAQASAGLTFDTTLMWNDRPGFRNGTALPFSPLNQKEKINNFTVLPTIAMDSHFFDYSIGNEEEQFNRLKHYLDEVRFVKGEAAIVWHHRVFHSETGWGNLYNKLLNYIKIPKNDAD